MADSTSKDGETNWDYCFICQEKKKKDKCRFTEEGISSLSEMLQKFANLGRLDVRLTKLCEKEDLKKELMLEKAKYHPTCKSRYDNTHFERELQKQKKQEDEEGESPIKRRRSSFASDNFKLGSLICCFCNGNDVHQNLCAAGAYHSSQR